MQFSYVFFILALTSLVASDDTTYIRFVNAVLDLPSITVTTSANLPSIDLAPTQITEYIAIQTVDGSTSVSFSSAYVDLTTQPLTVQCTSPFTLVVILLDHNNNINLIPYNETLAASMINNPSTDGSAPDRSWVRVIGLNHDENTLLVSLNDSDTGANLFNHVAFLEATPYVEIPSSTHQLVAYISDDSSAQWTIVPNFANSTAYTVFFFSNSTSMGVTLAMDRPVAYTYVPPSTTASIAGSATSTGSASESSSTGTNSGSASTPTETTSTSSGDLPSTPSIIGVANDEGSTSSSFKISASIAVIAALTFILA